MTLKLFSVKLNKPQSIYLSFWSWNDARLIRSMIPLLERIFKRLKKLTLFL